MPEFQQPLSWSSPEFSFEPYNLIFLPGGHEKSVRQLIDSQIIHRLLASYFPDTAKPSKKTVAAVCHGVMVLSETKRRDKSVIHECTTTALPARFEQSAYWGTRLFLGDYYKTYGAGSDDVETSVSGRRRSGIEPNMFPRFGNASMIRTNSTRVAWESVRKSFPTSSRIKC